MLPTRVLAPAVWTDGAEGFAEDGIGAGVEAAAELAGGADEGADGLTTVAVLVCDLETVEVTLP